MSEYKPYTHNLCRCTLDLITRTIGDIFNAALRCTHRQVLGSPDKQCPFPFSPVLLGSILWCCSFLEDTFVGNFSVPQTLVQSQSIPFLPWSFPLPPVCSMWASLFCEPFWHSLVLHLNSSFVCPPPNSEGFSLFLYSCTIEYSTDTEV